MTDTGINVKYINLIRYQIPGWSPRGRQQYHNPGWAGPVYTQDGSQSRVNQV